MGTKRFDGRMQTFETEVRILSYFHDRDMEQLSESDLAIIRYFCEETTVHQDCSTCIESIVNSQYRFCGWCATDDTCRSILDISQCELKQRIKQVKEVIPFISPYYHQSLCPIKLRQERGALGCSANQNCESCLFDHACLWCDPPPDSMPPLPPANVSHFYTMTPGVAPKLDVTAAPSPHDTGIDSMNYTATIWEHYRTVAEDVATQQALLSRALRTDDGISVLREISTYKELTPRGYCVEDFMQVLFCPQGTVVNDRTACPSSQRYLITPTSNPIPPWDVQILWILCIPFGVIAILILVMQCVYQLRNRRQMADWTEHMVEVTEQQKARKTARSDTKVSSHSSNSTSASSTPSKLHKEDTGHRRRLGDGVNRPQVRFPPDIA